MAEDKPKTVESETPSEPPPHQPPAPEPAKVLKDVEEKSVTPPPVPAYEEMVDDFKALDVVESVPESGKEKSAEGSINRDAVLTRVATEKRLSLIKAWEESEKSKAENKAHKELSSIGAWENRKKATIESELKLIEEQLEKKKAEKVEKMKNKVALIHKAAEEKRAMIEAKRGEELLKAEEMAAKYRATGSIPKKRLGFF